MKNKTMRYGAAAAAGLFCLAMPAQADTQVSVEDFNALKAAVSQLSEQMQALQKTNQLQEQLHEQDIQEINELKAKLAVTQQTATDAEQKSIAAAAAASAPPERPPLDEATVNHNFMLLGDAEFQYDKTDGQNGTFLQSDFAPIFLYRGGDNLLFEAGFDTTLSDNATNSPGYTTTFNLSFAQLDYVINDYLTLCAGDLILPLGTYTERGAGWLNKIPGDPIAVDALLPGTGIGAQLRGAVPVGQQGKFFNYSLFCVNGPGSSDGSGDAGALDLAGNIGVRSDGAVANLHQDPGGGGRIGFFVPFKPHYDLELGASAMTSEWDNNGSHLWSAGVLDAAVHLGANFEGKGEYIISRFGSDNMGEVRQQGYFVQASYKLAGLNSELPLINDTELVGRYDNLHDGMGTHTQRYTAGFVYYITNTLLFEGDYEFLHSTDPSQANTFVLQLSYGF